LKTFLNRNRSHTRIKEKLIKGILFLASLCSVFITGGIVFILVTQSLPFFKTVSLTQFFLDTQWTPLFSDAHYGIWPLISGTFLTTSIALGLAIPMGIIMALFLSEYAKTNVREMIKPALELLSAVPTVVYGYFALLFITPLLQNWIPSLSGFNVLSAGLTMGMMIIPFISSLSEDAFHAVPMSLREGSYAMGATRLQTAVRVVIPAAFSGVTASVILGISRAVGETMIVAIAAGMQPNFTWNPLEPAQTLTAYIVQVSLGDLPHGTLGYHTIFVAGLTLFLITFVFNVIGHTFRLKFREMY